MAPATPIVHEASNAGKAVALVLKGAGQERHRAAPNKVALIDKAPVTTDERDSAALAHPYKAGILPEGYVPLPEIDRLRTLVRARADLGFKMTRIKNQCHALVTRNLLDEEMTGLSDGFGVDGIRQLLALPLPEEEKGHLALSLQQLTILADQEETLHAEWARAAEERTDVRLLMTIPGVDYSSALAIVNEIGDIRRFPTKAQFNSLTGVVPRADNRRSESQPASISEAKRHGAEAVSVHRGPGDALVEAGDHPQAVLHEEGEDHRVSKGPGRGGEEARVDHLVHAEPQ